MTRPMCFEKQFACKYSQYKSLEILKKFILVCIYMYIYTVNESGDESLSYNYSFHLIFRPLYMTSCIYSNCC